MKNQFTLNLLILFCVLFAGCSEYNIDDETCNYDICNPRRTFSDAYTNRLLRALLNDNNSYEFYLYNATGTDIVDTLNICNPLAENVDFNGELFLVTANVKTICPDDLSEKGTAYLSSIKSEPFCTVNRSETDDPADLINTEWQLVGEIGLDKEITYPPCDYIGVMLQLGSLSFGELSGGLNDFNGEVIESANTITFNFKQQTSIEGFEISEQYESWLVENYFSSDELSYKNSNSELKLWSETGQATDTLLFQVSPVEQ